MILLPLLNSRLSHWHIKLIILTRGSLPGNNKQTTPKQFPNLFSNDCVVIPLLLSWVLYRNRCTPSIYVQHREKQCSETLVKVSFLGNSSLPSEWGKCLFTNEWECTY